MSLNNDQTPTRVATTHHPYFPGLDTLRALAILMVMSLHAGKLNHWAEAWPWWRHGWAGVDLFFVLSGFLIGSQLLREVRRDGTVGFARFYGQRAFRILPAFWVVLALYLAFPQWEAVAAEGGIAPWWGFVFFLVNFSWVGKKGFALAWSLCVEEHFYLVIPWLISFYAARKRRFRPEAATVSVVVGGMLLRLAIFRAGAPFSEGIYRPNYCRLDGLTMGLCLALLREFRPSQWQLVTAKPWILILAGVTLTGGGMAAYGSGGLSRAVFAFPLVSVGFAALTASALAPGFWLASLRVPGASAIATGAYSIYLTHKQMVHLGHGFISNPDTNQFAVIAVTLPLVAAAALALHWGVERPFLKLRHRTIAQLTPQTSPR